MHKILVINPGSTSTKTAIYDNEELFWSSTIRHSMDDLNNYKHIVEQFEFRLNHIYRQFESDSIDLSEIKIIVGRGGLLRPMESGVYLINNKIISDLKNSVGGEHASNLGALLADEISKNIPDCTAFIADPVVVDELQDVARISGLPQFPRRSTFHALNHKAIARKYAQDNNTNYEDLRLVIAHLGGGISVAAHRYGRVIDTNQALDGFGPFSPERAGTMDAGNLIRLCFNGEIDQMEIQKMLVGKGGLIAHLGTNDVMEVEKQIESGNSHSKLVLEAMAYQVGKEIGAMLAVLGGRADAVILTGGIAHSKFTTNYISNMLQNMAKIVIYPGEDEMLALAQAGIRILKGEKPKLYY